MEGRKEDTARGRTETPNARPLPAQSQKLPGPKNIHQMDAVRDVSQKEGGDKGTLQGFVSRKRAVWGGFNLILAISVWKSRCKVDHVEPLLLHLLLTHKYPSADKLASNEGMMLMGSSRLGRRKVCTLWAGWLIMWRDKVIRDTPLLFFFSLSSR